MSKHIISCKIVTINPGKSVELAEPQAKVRMHTSRKIADGIYELTAKVQFMKGEMTGLDIDLPRSLADQMEVVDKLEVYQRALVPTEEEIQAEKDKASAELKARQEADEQARRKAMNDEMLQNIQSRSQPQKEAETEDKKAIAKRK